MTHASDPPGKDPATTDRTAAALTSRAESILAELEIVVARMSNLLRGASE